MTTDHERIWMEAHRASQAGDYFDARPDLDDQTHTQVFDAAFRRGWELQQTEIDALRDALTWYAEMAMTMQRATMNMDNQLALHILKELALDGGKKARNALEEKALFGAGAETDRRTT